jgi:hypothetical protein
MRDAETMEGRRSISGIAAAILRPELELPGRRSFSLRGDRSRSCSRSLVEDDDTFRADVGRRFFSFSFSRSRSFSSGVLVLLRSRRSESALRRELVLPLNMVSQAQGEHIMPVILGVEVQESRMFRRQAARGRVDSLWNPGGAQSSAEDADAGDEMRAHAGKAGIYF